MPRCAVIGDPVEHSLSPVIHRAGFVAAGLDDFSYDALRVEAGGVAEFLDSLGPEWVGLSVTAPHKREALALAESVTDRAELAGGANTLVRTATGWAADNTDLPGAVAAIRERFSGDLVSATILGGGATAASIGLALADLGVVEIELAVREPRRAEETAEAIEAHPAGPTVSVVPFSLATAGDVLVSTIPVAAQSDELLAKVFPAKVVFEATYNTWPTPVVTQAEAGSIPVVSGMDLLIHQALFQFAQFTGCEAPLEQMRHAGEEALAARSK